MFDTVGYFVKMLWNTGRLNCSSRFERTNIEHFVKKPTTFPQTQFDSFYFQLTCGQIALAQMQFWFSDWREALCKWQDSRVLRPANLSANQLLCLRSRSHFAPCSKLCVRESCLSPTSPANKGVTERGFIEHLCARHLGGAVDRAVNRADNSCLHGAYLLLVHSTQERQREVNKYMVCPGASQPPPPWSSLSQPLFSLRTRN